MNKVELMGRLVKEPDIRYTQGNNSMAIAKFTLAVDRRFKKEGQPTADFINCQAFGKTAEIIEKYVTKGTKVCVCGAIQTGSYDDKNGNKVYTTTIIVEELHFCESKNASSQAAAPKAESNDGFMSIPSGLSDELPFA